MAALDPGNAALAATAGAILSGVGYGARRLQLRVRTRRVRSFWHPFMRAPLTVFVTEYQIDGSHVARADIAKAAGGGWLISKGMGLALAEVRAFAHRRLAIPGGIQTRGDQTGSLGGENVIIIGSEASNKVAMTLMKRLRETFRVPYRVEWNDQTSRVEIVVEDGGERLCPSAGEDYALILKAVIPGVHSRAVMLISGCHMWGSKAGAQAAVSDAVLRRVATATDGCENVAFVVQTQILNDEAVGPELDWDGHRYIQELLPLRP